MLYPNAILISLTLSDDFLVIRTTDHMHGRSDRFYAAADDLRALLRDGHTVRDFDLRNSLQAWRGSGSSLGFCMTWLRQVGPGNEVHGCQQRFLLPAAILKQALDGTPVRTVLLRPEGEAHCPVTFDPGCSGFLHAILSDPRKKRALSKALRNSFHWPDEAVTLYRDTRDDFFFRARTLSGGLCLHQRIVKSRSGEQFPAFTYEVHT